MRLRRAHGLELHAARACAFELQHVPSWVADRRMQMVSSDVPSPFSADEVAELARGHGTEFSDGVSAWLEAFAQEPAEAFSAVEPILRSGEYGKDAGVGVRALAARLGIEGRVELARLEIESSEKSKPCLE